MPRILIVEDDTDINNSTAQYLHRQGCECEIGRASCRERVSAVV